MGEAWCPQALHGPQGPHVPIGSLTLLHQPLAESQSPCGHLCSAWSPQNHMCPTEMYVVLRPHPGSAHQLGRGSGTTQKRGGDWI